MTPVTNHYHCDECSISWSSVTTHAYPEPCPICNTLLPPEHTDYTEPDTPLDE
jgi:hypothetical protein